MKVIVHIGSEKTGSTSIQSFLELNREILLQEGVYFPVSIGDYNHVKLVTHCEDNSFQKRIYQLVGVRNKEEKAVWSQQLVASFSREIAEMPASVNTVVITSELFQTNLSKTEEVEVLKKLLQEHFADIKIVVYLRRQVDAAISLYSTHLRGGGTHDAPLKGNAGIQWRYNYKKMLDIWKSVFGKTNVIARIYEKDKLLDGNVVKDFCHHLGVADHWQKFEQPAPQNTSLSVLGQYLLYHANLHKMLKEDNRRTRKATIAFLEENYSGVSVTPEFSNCIEFQNRYTALNADVAAEWFDQDQLFAEFKGKKCNGGFNEIPEPERVAALEHLQEFIATL